MQRLCAEPTRGEQRGDSARHVGLLGILGLGLSAALALARPGGLVLASNEGHDMWIKILGLVCVGVFVGAALIEAKQIRKRHKDAEQDGDRDPEHADADAEIDDRTVEQERA